MEKLELKHLAPYLNYDLRIKTKHGWDTLFTLNKDGFNVDHEESFYFDEDEFKPILNSPEDYISKQMAYDLGWVSLEDMLRGIDKGHFTYKDYIFFCENHIDFQNLIPKGLAINKDTI